MNNNISFKELAEKRRSVNFFDPEKELEDKLLKKIINLAVLAPSSFNTQPWKIIAVKSKDGRKKLYEEACNQEKVLKAPVTLIILGDKDGYARDRDIWEEKLRLNKITEEKIEITYIFKGLSEEQKGAFYEFLVFKEEPEDTYAKITINYEKREDKYPLFSYSTGIGDGQRADFNAFELFQHYYLGALRDSTRDLMSTKNNILGNVIKQAVNKNETDENYTDIINNANDKLLKQSEVNLTKENINKKLLDISQYFDNKQIDLQISEANITYILYTYVI